jgi:hypothetical protein
MYYLLNPLLGKEGIKGRCPYVGMTTNMVSFPWKRESRIEKFQIFF